MLGPWQQRGPSDVCAQGHERHGSNCAFRDAPCSPHSKAYRLIRSAQFVGQVTLPDNNWAIDGTVFECTDGQLYFVWSGWTNSSTPLEQNLYIARMSSPTNISSSRVLLHEPTLDWQCSSGQGVNEGPEVLVHKGGTFLTYCA